MQEARMWERAEEEEPRAELVPMAAAVERFLWEKRRKRERGEGERGGEQEREEEEVVEEEVEVEVEMVEVVVEERGWRRRMRRRRKPEVQLPVGWPRPIRRLYIRAFLLTRRQLKFQEQVVVELQQSIKGIKVIRIFPRHWIKQTSNFLRVTLQYLLRKCSPRTTPKGISWTVQ
jgi:hypothetical protein